MIKRILVALDPDPDTLVAIAYASEIARRTGAEVTGLAIVDTEGIDNDTKGGGIGSLYFAEKLRERLTDETREKARGLIATFDRTLSESGISHRNAVEEGVPFDRIAEEAKYHDLIVVGREPRFFYGQDEERPGNLVRLVSSATCPVLVVAEAYAPVSRVLIAYDGSEPSTRSMREFARLQPFGEGVAVHLLSVYSRESDRAESELRLQEAARYLSGHGVVAEQTVVEGNPNEQIIKFAERIGAGAIVAGSHGVSALRRWVFGSTTDALIDKAKRPLFLAR